MVESDDKEIFPELVPVDTCARPAGNLPPHQYRVRLAHHHISSLSGRLFRWSVRRGMALPLGEKVPGHRQVRQLEQHKKENAVYKSAGAHRFRSQTLANYNKNLLIAAVTP